MSSHNWTNPIDRERAELRKTFVWRASSMLVNCVQLLCVGLLLEFMLFTGTLVPIGVRLLVIAFLLAGMSRSYGWLLLVAGQLALFVSEPSRSNIAIGPMQYGYCITTLTIVALAYSNHNSGRIISDWIASRASTFLQPHRVHRALTSDSGLESRQGPNQGSNQGVAGLQKAASIVLQLLIFNAVTICAAIMFLWLPITRSNSRYWLQLSLANDGMLWPGPMVITVAIFFLVLLQYAAWRQLTAAQAGLWLRAGFMKHHYRDLTMIVRRRQKSQRKPSKVAPLK